MNWRVVAIYLEAILLGGLTLAGLFQLIASGLSYFERI